MARWLLMQPHYLKVLDNDWEYKEVDRATGKNVRRTFNVPQFLNPYDPADWNYKRSQDDGDIIVTNTRNSEYPKDIYFIGDPTPDMKPMDAEAEAISATFAGKWNHPIESLAGNYSQSLVDSFQEKMAEVQTKNEVSNDSIAQALASIAKTQAMLVELLASNKAAALEAAAPAVARRA